MITKGIKELCAEAETVVETWTVDEARDHLEDEDVVFVDIRDIRELWREGAIPGAVHAPRGMLEFWVDPQSPYARDVFQSGQRFIFFLRRRVAISIGSEECSGNGSFPGLPHGRRIFGLEEKRLSY